MDTYKFALGRYHNIKGVQLFYGAAEAVEQTIRGIALTIVDRSVERVNIKFHKVDVWDESVADVTELNGEIGEAKYTIVRI